MICTSVRPLPIFQNAVYPSKITNRPATTPSHLLSCAILVILWNELGKKLSTTEEFLGVVDKDIIKLLILMIFIVFVIYY